MFPQRFFVWVNYVPNPERQQLFLEVQGEPPREWKAGFRGWLQAGIDSRKPAAVKNFSGFKTGMLDHFYSEQKLEDAIFYFFSGSKTFQPLV